MIESQIKDTAQKIADAFGLKNTPMLIQLISDGKKIAVIAVCEHEYSYALEDRMGTREYDTYETNDET